MLQISPEKVAHIIVRAREFDGKVSAWDEDPRSQANDDDPDAILEDLGNDPIVSELTAFIDGLNVDEQVSVVALMWIGRGTYDADELKDAMETAAQERVNKTSSYLLGVPLLADYLEEGLDKLGFSVGDVENDIL